MTKPPKLPHRKKKAREWWLCPFCAESSDLPTAIDYEPAFCNKGHDNKKGNKFIQVSEVLAKGRRE